MNVESMAQIAALLAKLELSERERDELHSQLHGIAKFEGPCAHGSDSWAICEECSKGTALDAAILVIKKLRSIEAELAISRALYDVAIKERDYERYLNHKLTSSTESNE